MSVILSASGGLAKKLSKIFRLLNGNKACRKIKLKKDLIKIR